MKEWFTSIELAGVVGLPQYPDGVRKKAERESWKSRKRVSGKGLEYHISAFPLETRKQIANSMASEMASSVQDHAKAGMAMAELTDKKAVSVQEKIENGRKLMTMKPEQRKRADTRLLILHVADVFLSSYRACGQLDVGRRLFCDAYASRQIDLPADVYEQQRPFSYRTLMRWQDALDSQGPAALGGNYQDNRETKLDRNQDLAQFLLAVVGSKPHLANKWQTLHELATQYSSMNQLEWDIPSASCIRRYITKWLSENKAAFTYLTNPDAYNNQYRTAIETMYQEIMSQPNDVWEFDSTPVDAMLDEGRHSIIAVIDVFTRRVRLLVAKSSSSEGICLLLRKTFLSWGTLNPNGVMRTDNGSDYVSKRVMSICSLLDINVSRSNAYSGWEKPHIERFFRTLSHGMIELLPSYIGHCVADRSVIEARKSFAQRLADKRKPDSEKEIFKLAMSACELQTLLDNWVEARYHNKKHSTLKMTPNEKYQQSQYQRSAIADESALDLLLNHVGEATVSKGFIKVGGLKYTAPELMENTWKGQRVSVFLDPTDVGRAILYRAGQWDSERVDAVDVNMIGNGISPDQFRAKKRADNKALASFRREMKKLAETWGVDSLHQDVINHFVEQAKDTIQFRQQDVPLDNPALAALSNVVTAREEKTHYSEAELAALEARRTAKQAEQQLRADQDSKALKTEFEQALILAEKQLDVELSARESEWLSKYLRTHKLMAKRITRQIEAIKEKRQTNSDSAPAQS